MRIDETIYNEYASWQLENSDFLSLLKEKGNDLYYRFKHVFDVIDYLYLQLVEDDNYSEEEDQIFQTGYFYVANQLLELKEILKSYYNDDLVLANKFAKDINLLLNTQDFQAEVLNSMSTDNTSLKKLLEFDKKIIKYISKQETIPEKVFKELDNILIKVFDEREINYLTVNNIFLEIADELNIL